MKPLLGLMMVFGPGLCFLGLAIFVLYGGSVVGRAMAFVGADVTLISLLSFSLSGNQRKIYFLIKMSV